LARLKNGHGGFREFRRDGHKLVESFEPVGVGGWGVVTEQQASEFFGPIRTSRVRVNLALLALLLAAASGLAVLSHKRALAMARINHQAFHDTLTGLANRALFLSRLDAALARARRHGGDVAVLFLDLDRFKVVNDSLGHDAGDAVLIEAANRIAANIRADETFARMGGDEFTILIESSDGAHDAARIAERILKVLDVPMTVNGQEVLSSASIGIAVCVDGLDSADDLVRDADLAMYRAKDHGRARYELFEVAMGETARHKLEFENALRRAIDHGELVMHYQPVVNLETGEVVAAEALVRWQHPQRGLLPPSEFMPIAEETGLCIPLGRWVLHTALTQLQAWTALAPERRVRMNVNLGPGQIRSQTLVSDVADALSATGADPSLVVLELSETTIMDDTNAAIDRLDQLRALGVELAIDDFGTGYASISWLKRLPVTVLKLDGVFVRDIETDPDDAAIARSLIDLARQLNIRVTAERVETGGQMLALRAMGCSLGQGHLFSPPVDALHFASLLHVGTLVDRV
jgi:diguanylate cyclase (GGDEF)-like protein